MKKNNLLSIFFISIAAFISRLLFLLKIPIFTDEAIYIRWAQIGLADPAQRYISLTDGKQPLFTWLMYPMLKIFTDPLYAGRFVSVLSGVLAVVGIYLLADELFGKKIALYASAAYIISPFTFLYDRLALMDSLLASIGIWILYLEVLLVKNPRLDLSLLLGLTLGINLMNKSSSFLYIYLLPVSLMLFNKNKSNQVAKLLSWIGYAILSIFIAQIIYNSLRLSPWFYIIEQKNYSFIFTIQEFINKPFVVFLPNLNGLTSILISYMTPIILLMVIIDLAIALISKNKAVIFLFCCFLFPFLSLAAFGKVIFPRFILFMTMPLFLITGHMIFIILNRLQKVGILKIITILVIFAQAFWTSFTLLVNPVEANIHIIDRKQLFDDWPSGWGVSDVIAYLKDKSQNNKIVIGTEGTFGLNPAVYEIYFNGSSNAEIYGFWPISQIPEKLINKADIYPTYLIFKERQEIPDSWHLTLIKKIRRGKGDTFLLFYQVNKK
ncbi:hypothetical protein A2Y99_03755 [Candidatus Gottesmanbacteria bacterium RBG_13_37_7]|uniref:Glycosyltransferase RgtA/B/C/D-like domain-containing protein n=1 Tax=Candidatus Gottesmanbacteria bacterium RBG_13_37_7 TaxID=1798369 RepID=A0A1F5YKB2_9BACT|nr:MAG: hypothetical protein A2Y99_03755 [Candidatus Gottesmanbacteria bacterium RBG_13_37_7]